MFPVTDRLLLGREWDFFQEAVAAESEDSEFWRGRCALDEETIAQLGLNTILPSPILYDVWHTKGGSGGRHTLRNRRAIVLQ